MATTAGNLMAKQVIHALAAANGTRTIAFPSLSTGAYRFPIKTASRIAWETIFEYCRDHPKAFDEVRLVTFSEKDREVYCEALESLA